MNAHTPGPWVQFADKGKTVAIMPAGRDGDICTFSVSPSDADARLMNAAPELLSALREVMEWIDGWDPRFIEDPEWGGTKARIDSALAKAKP